MSKNIEQIDEEINNILTLYNNWDSSQIGLVVTWTIEYLINERNYDFEKMMKTIRRCHDKILKDKQSTCN